MAPKLDIGVNEEVRDALVDAATLAHDYGMDSVEFIQMAKIAFVDGKLTNPLLLI